MASGVVRELSAEKMVGMSEKDPEEVFNKLRLIFIAYFKSEPETF